MAGNKAETSFGWAAAGRRSEMSIFPRTGSCHHRHKNWNCSLKIIQDWILGGFPLDQTLAGAKLAVWRPLCCDDGELFVLQLPTFILPIKSYQTSNYQEDSWASVWRLDCMVYSKHQTVSSMKWNTHNLSTLIYSMSMILNNRFFPKNGQKQKRSFYRLIDFPFNFKFPSKVHWYWNIARVFRAEVLAAYSFYSYSYSPMQVSI